MVDAHDTANKFLSKHRWGAKFLSSDKAPKEPKPVPQNPNLNDDVNDFLRPSTEKAQAHKAAAAAAFVAAGATKPRIDVARAQRWPAASDILNSAGVKSPGIGGLKTGRGRKGLTVNFARDLPAVIGEGGDECEEPSIEVSRRRKANRPPDANKTQAYRDDMNLPTRSFSGREPSINKEAERRGIVTRTLTSHGELSPPLRQKMEVGHINTHASPPMPPPRHMGSMGLGERPRPLQRAPTGFDLHEDTAGRPSMDSTYSHDSDNVSPVVARKAPSIPPTHQEELENFRPKPLKRTQTGWSEHEADSDNEPPPPIPSIPRLPEMNLKDDSSPLDSTLNKFLQSEPSDPNSFSARVIHKMRAEEGMVLHEATRRATNDLKRNSGSSTSSNRPGSEQSNPFQVGTPPQTFTNPMAGKTPPRQPTREPSPVSTFPQRSLAAEDPHRSRMRGPSPGRKPLPPGSFPLDTNPRPPSSSSSSQYTMPSTASRTRESPTGQTDPLSATTIASIQQTPSSLERGPFSASANTQTSIAPIPPQFVKPGYVDSSPNQAPPPPPHSQDSAVQSYVPYRRDTVNESQSTHRQPISKPIALARSDTRLQGDAALTDFADRVTHMQGIFRLTAELGGQIFDKTPMQWLRIAIWWLLKGRTGMEALIRSRPKNGEPQPERLAQPHVDLAKTWWIITDVIHNHPSLRNNSNISMDAQANAPRDVRDLASGEVYEVLDILIASLKMLLGSMQRHQSMPPTQALIQGQDQSICVEYPRFAPDAQSVLSGFASNSAMVNEAALQPINPADAIPVGDTKADFCYFRIFVENAWLSTDDPNTDRVPLPIVVSVLRPREELKVKLSICSQSDLINIVVGSGSENGPTWRDVVWKSKTRGFSLQLRHGFVLNLEFAEQDFRSLWAIVDHTNRVDANLRERSDERLCSKMYLRNFTYKDPLNPAAFPPERVRGCKLMVFEKSDRSSEGTGKRRLHRGYRLVVVTNPKSRTLSCVNHEMGTKQEPMNFEYATDPDNAPAMKLRFKEGMPDQKTKICSMYVVFNDSKERNHLFGTFTSMNQAQDEAVFAQVPLKSFNIESADQAEGFTQKGSSVLQRLQWQEVKVLNHDAETAGLETAPTVMSESLRFVCRHGAGVVSDRMNLGPGELLVRLPIDGAAELSLLRNPQFDMAVAIDAGRTEKDIPDALAELLRTLTTASTIRKLTFNSFKDLHSFQLAVTGFAVKFDGIASTFQISRRRMVVPIYKQWTANTIRIQIVVQDNIVQLLAFFEEFSHADAMNFQLKSMDVFEKTEKGGKPGIRLVDAKFALPVEERRGEGKMGKEEGKISGWAGMKRKFVCLDVIEYPGEHDDVLISFDSAETRDKFAEALPAATMERKFTVRRKI